jgi:hypothetical protein
MQDSNNLIQSVVQGIEASSKTSPIEAGPDKIVRPEISDIQIDTVNEVFTLFRINYHNQYYKAYSDTQVLNQIKRLWMESLRPFSAEAILQGARKVIEQSEYLPTLHRMIRACQGDPDKYGLVDAHTAYVEACRASSPKANYAWSHAAVYHAGCASDWFFLANNAEKNAFPIFERHYLKLCERVMSGEKLPAPNTLALPETIETPLSKAENQRRMEALRKQLDV